MPLSVSAPDWSHGSEPNAASVHPAERTGNRPVAVVTGASGGIGRAISQLLALRGHDILVHYGSHSDRAAETCSAVIASGGRVAAFGADLSLIGAAEAILRRTLEVFGRVDILVNNAAELWFGDPRALRFEEFAQLFWVNVWGPYALMSTIGPCLPRGGRIVNISSDATRFPRARVAAYAASKAALESLTKSFAEELGPRGITVNAVAPGPTRTQMLKPMLANPHIASEFESSAVLGGIAEPEDIANVVAFLASPEAGRVTGQFIDATGGRIA